MARNKAIRTDDGSGLNIATEQLSDTDAVTKDFQRTITTDFVSPGQMQGVRASGGAKHVFATDAAQLTSASINFAASGDNTLIAAVAAQTHKVYALFLVITSATNLTFKDGASSLTGAMPFNSNGAMTLDFVGEPHFTGSTNTNFILNSSNAVQVSGRIYYITS